MSISKALLIHPRPCPFCGGEDLEMRAFIFRQWSVHCLNTDCLSKGPDGKTMDIAISKWNSLTENCITQRQNDTQLAKDYQNPEVIKKIWKTLRTRRTFTINELIRFTGCHQETIEKYLKLLQDNKYIRAERQPKNAKTYKSTSYRCLKPRIIEAPSWLDLQLSPYEYQIFCKERKSLKWTRIKASTD